jgi:HEAT repeat protein
MNEEEVKIKIVLPLLRQLGFDDNDLRFESFTQSSLSNNKRLFSDVLAFKGGRPVLLVEVKSSSTSLNGTSGREAFEQVLRYARTAEIVVPYALVTNGTHVLFIDVFEGRLVIDRPFADAIEVGELRSIELALASAIQRLQRARADSLATLGFITNTELFRRCKRQREIEIGALVAVPVASGPIVDRKYIPALYVNRELAENEMAKFLPSDFAVFGVIGDAGMGKTNLLCHLSEQFGTAHPALFYVAADFTRSILSTICSDLDLTFTDWRQLVDSLNLVPETQHFLLFIDGINEAIAHRSDLLVELNALAQAFGGSKCRIIISCRTLDWQSWSRTINGALSVLGRATYQAHSTQRPSDRAFALEALTEREFRTAWERYSEAFRLRGELSARMAEMCREPFMLRLVAEVYHDGKPLPDFIEPIELFKRYFEEKFPNEGRKLAVSRALSWLAEQILETGEPRVPYHKVRDSDLPAVNQLLDENVVIYRKSGFISFHFELFLEYVVAEHLANTTELNERLRVIRDLYTSRLVNSPGIVENLLLWWNDDQTVVIASNELLKQGDKWKAIVCSVLRKNPNVHASFRGIIEALAVDANYVIRLFLAQSLIHYVGGQGSAVIGNLAQSPEWESRETAANAIGFLVDPTEVLQSNLLELSSDFHWRVRRAAGYSFNRLVSNQPHEALLDYVITQLTKGDWRARYACCIALISTDLDEHTRHAEALLRLTRDRSAAVRWTLAHYLPRYRGVRRSQVLAELIVDPEPWVRRKAVSSAIDLFDVFDTTRTLQRLTEDADAGVRVALARNVPRLTDRDLSIRLMQRLMLCGDDSRFAAAYTLYDLGVRENTDAETVLNNCVDKESRSMRERIARRDVDVATSRFAGIGEYIARRTEYTDRGDPYMDIIDTMCSLIQDTTAAIHVRGQSLIPLFDLLAADSDEAVRWALVLYLSKYNTDFSGTPIEPELFGKLAADQHWWVRREVANSLREMDSQDSEATWRRILLEGMINQERENDAEGSDEVLFFAIGNPYPN